MPDNDLRDMGRNLETASPLMVIPNAVAKVGQIAQDTYDSAKRTATPYVNTAQQKIQQALLALMAHAK